MISLISVSTGDALKGHYNRIRYEILLFNINKVEINSILLEY